MIKLNALILETQDSHSVAGQVALNKKQGVSGQSVSVSNNINIDKVEKDFHTRTLIKEAIEDNDFLKNLSASQVRSSLLELGSKHNGILII